jgi:hypothetical protein
VQAWVTPASVSANANMPVVMSWHVSAQGNEPNSPR